MPAIDDGRSVKLYGQGGDPTGSKEVIIGTRRTAAQLASGDKLASFCADADGPAPSELSYIDYQGAFTGSVIGGVSGDVTGNLDGNVNGDLTGAANITAANGTAASGTGITVNNTSQVRTVIHKITLTYQAFQAAALTKDVTIWTLPAKTSVKRVIADVTTKFLGGAISAVVLRAGKAADGAGYLVDGDVFTAAITLGDVVAEMGADLKSATLADVTWASTQIVNVRLTATTANLSELTQGSVTFYIEVATYP